MVILDETICLQSVGIYAFLPVRIGGNSFSNAPPTCSSMNFKFIKMKKTISSQPNIYIAAGCVENHVYIDIEACIGSKTQVFSQREFRAC